MTKVSELPDYDVLDIVYLCHAGMAQDSPKPATDYLNQILNITFGYLTPAQRTKVEEYLLTKSICHLLT